MSKDRVAKIDIDNGTVRYDDELYIREPRGILELRGIKLRIRRSQLNDFHTRAAAYGFEGGAFELPFDSSAVRNDRQIWGEAVAEDCSLAIIGNDALTTKHLELRIHSIDEESEEFVKFAWLSRIYFFGFNWEFGWKNDWILNINMPSSQFSLIVDEIRLRRVFEIYFKLVGHTDLFMRDADRHRSHSDSLTWYLRPDKDGHMDMPEPAVGRVESMTWLEGYLQSENREIDNKGLADNPELSTKSACHNNYDKSIATTPHQPTLIWLLYILSAALVLMILFLFFKSGDTA